ncbi:hypothetical protein AVEN_27467-1 [Araneus ventricosus]|uniref:Uncharacterized protein n=1 Tax=Araneus ventricosus TaxID=182803 RepID=A0A4Y2K657_ARAVE|nr:hypothetical protein AVEN_27467-1 [Araneus ventricosus]
METCASKSISIKTRSMEIEINIDNKQNTRKNMLQKPAKDLDFSEEKGKNVLYPTCNRRRQKYDSGCFACRKFDYFRVVPERNVKGDSKRRYYPPKKLPDSIQDLLNVVTIFEIVMKNKYGYYIMPSKR